jgi:hemoglobin
VNHNERVTTTFYAEIGGEETITRIVAAFYRGVADDPYLRAIYPEDDLGPAEERFRLFLVQYWGGPTTYSEQRGHPRLRMRHAPFAVTPKAKEHWLQHFRAALDEVALPPEQDAQFWEYVTHAAQFMVNSFDSESAEVRGPDIPISPQGVRSDESGGSETT